MSQIFIKGSAGGAGTLSTLTGDAGGAISPVLGDIHLVGGTGISTSGAGHTITFTMASATTAVRGGVFLATNAETRTGTDTAKCVTPDDLNYKLGTQTLYALPIGNASTGSLAWTAAPTNGQILIGSTGVTPVLGTITAGTGLAVTNGAGSITVGANASLTTATGWESWGGAGNYFDDTTLGSFTVSRPGTGYIKGVSVSWSAPQTVAGLTAGNTYFIYMDSTGTIGKTTSATEATFTDNIVLFECMRDSTAPTNNQYTVKENHSYNFQVSPSSYLHNVIGNVIENNANGANITLSGTVKIYIAGADVLNDHGLKTTISDTGGTGVVWNKYYTNAGGKWCLQNATDTFAGYYNNAGTPTVLTAGRFAVYTLYVAKDDLNSATPKYFTVLNTAQFTSTTSANTAISNGSIAKASGELLSLEVAQLGYIIFSQTTGTINTVTISKATLKQTLSTSGTNTASLVQTSVTSFNGILSGADTNVQAALDTIDEFGKNLTDKSLVVGNGNGQPLGVIAVGGTGTILTGVAANDPTWTTATYPATLAKGLLMVATAANVINGLTGSTGTAGQLLVSGGAATEPTWTTNTYATTASAGTIIVATAANTIGELASTGTAGQILTSGGAATVPTWTTATYPATLTKGDVLCATAANVVGVRAAGTTGQIMTAVTTDIPTWTTATYPATVAIGDVLVASAANVIGVVTGGTTAGHVLTANGAGSAPTFQAASGGGIGTLAGDSGTATGATVTIAGGTNLTSAAGTATLTLNLDAAITAMTSISMANAGSIQTNTTDTHTMLIQAYDVDGTAYVPFITLTNANTPTCDLASAVTIGSAYIYRGSGTDVAVADGGTGASTLTDHGVLIGNGVNAVTATAEGGTGVILTGVTGAVPAWTTATYPATIAKGEILHASAANVISALTAGTADYVLTAHGNGNAVTWEAAAGGGIGTLAGDSGTATGATVTIAGGTNLTTVAATATVTINLDAAISGTTSITGANGCELRTNTTAADTLILAAYDVGTTSYTPFVTLAAHATDPTCDLAAGVTIGSAYIYRGSGTDVAVADGGTGASTLTDHGVLIGNATSAVTATAEGATGEILIGTTANPPSWLAASTDGKVLTAHTGAAPTWETPGGGGITWSTETGATAALAADHGYVMDRGTAITATLPASCALYKTIKIVGKGAGLTIIAQNANQMIHHTTGTTTTGVGGSLTAIGQYDCIELTCTVADLEFTATSITGNWTGV